MRNLKRVLSLALATAMLLGMMVMGAGAADKTAADLTDSDKIVNKEAVTLLVDLGVIEGKTDGSYSPTEVVNRATMAKLITMMLVGNVDQNSYKGTATDLTDVDGHWAEGYIKYCYSNKIITGDGAGHFFPDQPVTVVQAAKMILVALGYDADDRGYQNNSNWSNKIMSDAAITKESATVVRPLTKGISVKASDSLTRDNAAQMIFNALFVQTVEPEYAWDMGEQHISKYNPLLSLATTIYGGLTRYAGVLDSISNGYGVSSDIKNAAGTSKTLSATDKITASANDIGSTIVVYKDSADKFVSSAAVASAATALATSTNGTAFANLTTKGQRGYLGYEIAAAGAKVYVNGVAQNSGAAYANLAALKSAMSTTYDKVGTQIEFLSSADGNTYDIVRVTEYVFSKVDSVTAEKSDGTEATVKIANVKYDASAGITENASSVAVPKSAVVGDFDNLAKGDYVMYAIMGSGAGNRLYVYEPEMITGSMSGYNTAKKTLTVDGTVYTTSQADNHSGLTSATAANTTGVNSNYYLDANGYVVATNAIAQESTIGVVLARDLVKASSLGGSEKNSITIAREDGTVVNYTYAGLNDMSDADLTALLGKLGGSTNGATTGNAIKFTLNADDEITSVTQITDTATSALAKKTATLTGVSGKYMTSETTFMYVTTSAGSYKFNVFTGIDNLFAVGSQTLSYVVDPTNSSKITHVIVKADASSAANAGKDVAYAMATGGESDGTYTTGSFAVAGELTDLKTINAGAATAGLVYTYATDSKGVTTLTPVKDYANKSGETTTYFKATVKVVDSKFVVVTTDATTYGSATDIVVYFADKCNVYDVTSSDAVNAGTLAADQEITLVVDSSDTWTSMTASSIFITK